MHSFTLLMVFVSGMSYTPVECKTDIFSFTFGTSNDSMTNFGKYKVWQVYIRDRNTAISVADVLMLTL